MAQTFPGKSSIAKPPNLALQRTGRKRPAAELYVGPPSSRRLAVNQESGFVGVWRITEMEQWDRDYIDLDGPGFIKFDKGGVGALRFGAVEVELDCRAHGRVSQERIEFSFEGHNDADPCSDRGWAEIRNGELYGNLFIQHGDHSWFRAVRQ